MWLVTRRVLINVITIVIIVFPGILVISRMNISNWWMWTVSAIIASIYAVLVTVFVNIITYRDSTVKAVRMLIMKNRI